MKIKLCLLTTLITPLFLNCQSTENLEAKLHISGGYDAKPEDAEYFQTVGFVYKYDNSEKLFTSCTGSIISKRTILTAAHCGDTYTPRFVGFGHSLRRESVGDSKVIKKVRIKQWLPHPDYKINGAGGKFDIALVILAEDYPAPWTEIELMSPGDMVQDGQDVRVAGFGAQSENGSSDEEYGDLSILETKAHVKRGPPFFKDGESNLDFGVFYTVVQDGKSSCKGDSGGPILAMFHGKWKQVAITTMGGAISCDAPRSGEANTGTTYDLALVRRLKWIAENLE